MHGADLAPAICRPLWFGIVADPAVRKAHVSALRILYVTPTKSHVYNDKSGVNTNGRIRYEDMYTSESSTSWFPASDLMVDHYARGLMDLVREIP